MLPVARWQPSQGVGGSWPGETTTPRPSTGPAVAVGVVSTPGPAPRAAAPLPGDRAACVERSQQARTSSARVCLPPQYTQGTPSRASDMFTTVPVATDLTDARASTAGVARIRLLMRALPQCSGPSGLTSSGAVH